MAARRILITGASAGIGAALARRLAGPDVTLGLVARREERLADLREELASTGATVHPLPADVGDAAAMARTVRGFAEQAGGVELVIANAGISERDALFAGDATPADTVLRTNVLGVVNTLVPAVPLMREAGGGHLVAVGSVAGFRGLPGKGAYSASKAAVKTLMDAWRPNLRPAGIHMTTLCPGWIESELTAKNDYPMPFIMPAARAADIMARAIEARRNTVVFPWQMRLVVPLMRIVPDRLLPSYAARD